MKKIFILLVILPLVTLAMYPGNPRRYNKGARYEHRYNRKYGRPSRPEYRKRYQKYDDYPPWHHHENGEKEPVVTKEPTIPTNSDNSFPSLTDINPNHLFITRHPREITKFEKYFVPNQSFQPLHGIDHKHHEDHEDHEDHEHPEDHEHASGGHPHGHDHNDMPNLPDFSLCAHEINVAGDLLVSSFNAPECPLMDFDEAQNFCLDHGMRSVSLSSSLSFDERMHKLDIAELTLNGFWTIGFIENPNKAMVVWGAEMDEIDPDVWADGQPDGPKEGTMGSIEFCVAVQKSNTPGNLAKLHDKLCNAKMAAVCEPALPMARF